MNSQYLLHHLNFIHKIRNVLTCHYRKLPINNTGDTLKGPDGTVIVTDHDILYFEINDS